MENIIWKMMINNAKVHLRSIKESDMTDPENQPITVWQISEVLALLTGKLKEDIVLEIVGNRKSVH